MPQKDDSCQEINAFVKQYYFILQTTTANSPERQEAGIVYKQLVACFEKISRQKLNLNKLAPQTLHFLNAKNLKLKTKRAGSVKKPVKRKKRPKSWDFR